MNTPFDTDVKNCQELLKKSFFLSHLYLELHNIAEDNITLESIFERLLSSLKSCPFISYHYLNNYYDRLCYELTMDIYNTSFSTLKLQSTEAVSIRDCISDYRSKCQISSSIETIEPLISKNKKKLLQWSKTYIYPGFFSMQAYYFFSFFNSFLPESGENFKPLLDKANLIFMLNHYPQCIYANGNYNTGISAHKFHEMIEEFITLNALSISDDFEKEFKVYQFEQLYRAIQFQNCIVTYYKNIDIDKKSHLNDFFLLLYSKLFCTPYISSTQYILDKNVKSLKSFFKSEKDEIRSSTFFDFQVLASFILPSLSLLIKEYLFDLYKGDISAIADISKKYIITKLKTNNFSGNTFCSLLINSTEAFSKAGYPQKPNSTSRKKLTDAVKKGEWEYECNLSLSRQYFCGDDPQYLPRSLSPDNFLYGFDSCYQYLLTYYKNMEKNYNLTLHSKQLLDDSLYGKQ